MARLILVWIFVLMSGFCKDATQKKPKMSPAKGELHLEMFDELKIVCYSKGAKLQFSFPETTVMIPRSDHEILQTKNGTYTFLRSNVVSSDAGWYACAEEGVNIDNHFTNLNHSHEDISWIYVYVIDGSNGFADGYAFRFPKTIIAVAGSTVIVPCRPRSPLVYVEFWQDFKRVEKDEITFDPKIGFIMRQVAFEAGEVTFQCKTENYRSDYIIRYSGPKPKMITAGNELILQKGDELRIECYSKKKLSFLFPNIILSNASIQSKYEIYTNKNGSNTFIRRSTISNDTGWYGCAGEGVQNNIPYHSINETKKEINWIYVYVNSSVTITSGLLIAEDRLSAEMIIPCRPTSPGLTIRLSLWYDGIVEGYGYENFDPKLGFVAVAPRYHGPLFNCTTDEPVYHSSFTCSLAAEQTEYQRPTRANADDTSACVDIILHMTGEDLCIVCEASIPESRLFHLESKVPSTISEDRVQLTKSRPNGRFENNIYLKQEKLLITIINVTEADSGEYSCLTQETMRTVEKSRHVEVFDRNGGRYMKLSKQGGAIHVTGLKEGTVRWLLDLVDFPSAEIKWYDPWGVAINVSSKSNGTKHVISTVYEKAPQKLFIMSSLVPSDTGVYLLHAEMGNMSALVNVTVNVQETCAKSCPIKYNDTRLYVSWCNFGLVHNPTIQFRGYEPHISTGHPLSSECLIFTKIFTAPPNTTIVGRSHKYSYQSGENLYAHCFAVGSPLPNMTWSFLNLPKFPSQQDSTRLYFEKPAISYLESKMINGSGSVYTSVKYKINMSGILTCEACNIVKCSMDSIQYIFSASLEPYFTSTSLNHSTVTLILEKDKPTKLVLECYVSGRPYPQVIWFRDNIQLEGSSQFKFAYNNSELTILYFSGGEGGRYTCRAENENGHVEDYIDVIIEEKGIPGFLWPSIIVVAFILLIVIAVLCFVVYKLRTKMSREKSINESLKRFDEGALHDLNPNLLVSDQAELLPYEMKWEFPRELLTLDKILGSGAFGIVRKAEAKSICRKEPVTTVAVKLVRSSATLNFITALTRELKILVYLGKHINVVNLLGACTKRVSYGELFVIVEYCRFGNLRDFLLRCRPSFVDQVHNGPEKISDLRLDADSINMDDGGPNSNANGSGDSSATEDCSSNNEDFTGTNEANEDCVLDKNSGDAPRWKSKYQGDYMDMNSEPICTGDLVYWSWQVSRGMDYLGKRKVLHGDLAARNILLADNGIVKICDFGLSKALHEEAQYRNKGGDPLPVKWMAIESIKDQIFSFQSDVWSFGVVMWEFFTLGQTPYPGIKSRELCQKLIDGHRMEKPKHSPSTIYDTMLDCWESDPARRPSFEKLADSFVDLLDEGFKSHYLEMNSLYTEIYAEMFNNIPKDYLTLVPPTCDALSSSTVNEQIEMESLPHDESGNSV